MAPGTTTDPWSWQSEDERFGISLIFLLTGGNVPHRLKPQRVPPLADSIWRRAPRRTPYVGAEMGDSEMRWLRDVVVVAGLVILRVGLPLAITVGIGKVVHRLLKSPDEGVLSSSRSAAAGNTSATNHAPVD